MNLYIIAVILSISFSGCVILFYDTLTNFILYTKTFHTFFSVDYSLILYETVIKNSRSKNGWDPYWSIQIYIYGGLFGMLLVWGLGNYISRKSHLIIGSFLITLTSLLMIFNISTSRYFYYCIHFVGGIGTAILRVISPIFLAEIATKSKRGKIISTFQSMKYFGRVLAIIVIIYLINNDQANFAMTQREMRRQWDKDHNPKTFSYETFSFPYIPSSYSNNFIKIVRVFPCTFFLLIILFFIPNTPRYLFYSKNYNKAIKVLYRLYTHKKLLIIPDENLPESFFQHIYQYCEKKGLHGKKSKNYNKISPITSEEEQKLNIYNHSIYSNSEKSIVDSSSPKTLTNDDQNFNRNNQVNNSINNNEKENEKVKMKKEKDNEIATTLKQKRKAENLEHMKRHGKEKSESVNNNMMKYKINDNIGITIKTTNQKKNGEPNDIYNNHNEPIIVSSSNLSPQMDFVTSKAIEMQKQSVLSDILNQKTNDNGNYNIITTVQRLNNNQRVYSKTKKQLVPKSKKSNIIINIGTFGKKILNLKHSPTEPSTSNDNDNKESKKEIINFESNNYNDNNESKKEIVNPDSNNLTIIINRDIYRPNSDVKKKKNEIKNKKVTIKSPINEKPNKDSNKDLRNSILNESSNCTLITKASSSESLAYHQFTDFEFDPIVRDHILEINREIRKYNEYSIFQLYWGQLKTHFGMIIIMNVTQQLLQFSIFISYFNLLGETILSNYLYILYFFLSEFFLYLPINIYFSEKNRKYFIFAGLIAIMVAYNTLLFLMHRIKNFYVYFASVLVILFNSTWNTVPIIYQSEIFPTRARVTGSALGCLMSQLCSLLFYLILPNIYEFRIVLFILVIFFVIIFILYGIFFMRDTSNVEIENIDCIFEKKLTPKKLTSKLKKISSLNNINPIKEVNFSFITQKNTKDIINVSSDDNKKISV